MSTRSHIIYKTEEGSYQVRYHHSDGYFSYLGNLLYKSMDEEDLKGIFEKYKNCSFIQTLEEYNKRDKSDLKDHRVFYCFKKVAARLYDDENPNEVKQQKFKTLKAALATCDEEYTYGFIDKEWYGREGNQPMIKLKYLFGASDLIEKIMVRKFENKKIFASNLIALSKIVEKINNEKSKENIYIAIHNNIEHKLYYYNNNQKDKSRELTVSLEKIKNIMDWSSSQSDKILLERTKNKKTANIKIL